MGEVVTQTKSMSEHPFAQYIRILGKGPNLSRPLTKDEAAAAMAMVMDRKIAPEQLGAFLCLLRVKTESPEEVAGLVTGIRSKLEIPVDMPRPMVDWASYAGKARRLPYYLLAALALSRAGISIFMHGAEDHTAGRVYTSTVLRALGVPVAANLRQAADHLEQQKFAYLTLPNWSPRLHEIMELRNILGVRSPVHTVARLVNPLQAPFVLSSVTHPPYLPVHQDGARLLGQKHMAVFKGDGGEAERRPEKPCEVWFLRDGQPEREEWPAMIQTVWEKEESLDLSRLTALWRGEDTDPNGLAAVLGSMAIVLRYSGRAATQDEALRQAAEMWQARA